MSYAVDNILKIIAKDGEDELRTTLSSFSCGINKDIQDFLQFKAIDFAKRKMSITYLVYEEETGKVLGFFTLAHKVLNIPAEGMSNTVLRRMDRYSKLDEKTNSYLVYAFLLAQLGKNYAISEDRRISGSELMDCVDFVLKDIQFRVGGGVVYLDSLDNEHLISFYENNAGYKKISERVSVVDGHKYLQYYKFI